MQARSERSAEPEAGEALDRDRLRALQSDCYQAEDFERFFACTRRLAGLCPDYAGSYEFHVHRVLHALARSEPAPFFVQVGGMEGKRFDSIYAFVKHYGWRGLILEPLPDLFEALAANYADAPGVTPINAALADSDGEREMLRVDRGAVLSGEVPVWAEGLGTFFPERNALGGRGIPADLHAALQRHARVERVRCLALRSLVERWRVPRIDLLQVDAEGCELDILRQVDWAAHRPRVVQVEHWALPAEESRALLALLAAQGYALRLGPSDVIGIDAALRLAD